MQAERGAGLYAATKGEAVAFSNNRLCSGPVHHRGLGPTRARSSSCTRARKAFVGSPSAKQCPPSLTTNRARLAIEMMRAIRTFKTRKGRCEVEMRPPWQTQSLRDVLQRLDRLQEVSTGAALRSKTRRQV